MTMPFLYGSFTCPLCGTKDRWGTSFVRYGPRNGVRIVKSAEDAYGHCNGWMMQRHGPGSCDFAWNRSEDEWVFVPYLENC